jgi:uncharacterized membrane-anchored protein
MSDEPVPMASRIERAKAMKSLDRKERNDSIASAPNVLDGRKFFEHRATQARLQREYRKPFKPTEGPQSA